MTGDARLSSLQDYSDKNASCCRLPFTRSPLLFTVGYSGAHLLCLLLIGSLLPHMVVLALLDLPIRTGLLCLVGVALVVSSGMLILGLAKRLDLACTIIDSRTVERDVAVSAIEISPNGILFANIADDAAPIVYTNPAFEAITGYSSAEARGMNCRYLQGSDRQQPEISVLRSAIERREPATVTLRNYRKDGRMFINELRLTPVRNTSGDPTHYVGVIRDVSIVTEALSQLSRATDLDRLTCLANRYRFHDYVENLIGKNDSPCVLVVKMNIVRFHEINTSFGHQTGDLLLVEIASRLRGLLGLVAGRIGADEFALAGALAGSDEVESVVERVRTTLTERFVLQGAIVEARFAIGFAVSDTGGDALTLLRQAGVALRQSKLTPLRAPSGYNLRSDANLRRRIRLTSELQQALAEESFVLHYQPKVVVRTGAIIGVEALIRWIHPVFGLQSPELFITIAEETSLILDIGEWVLRNAVLFAVRMNKDRPSPLSVSINVSMLQFLHRDIPKLLALLLEETRADASWITLELTESALAESTCELVATFSRLRQMGIGLSIDDFGTGYSNLRYLATFPLSEIKIGKSFVTNVQSSRFRSIVVESVIKIGRELNAAVIAEGVETAAEVKSLIDLDCPYGQGYFFGGPIPEEEFLKSIRVGGLPLHVTAICPTK